MNKEFLKSLKENDVVLTIDSDRCQELVVITCNDNGLWTRCYREHCSTNKGDLVYDTFEKYYKILSDYNDWILVSNLDDKK